MSYRFGLVFSARVGNVKMKAQNSNMQATSSKTKTGRERMTGAGT
jgi:hypothetical protein